MKYDVFTFFKNLPLFLPTMDLYELWAILVVMELVTFLPYIVWFCNCMFFFHCEPNNILQEAITSVVQLRTGHKSKRKRLKTDINLFIPWSAVCINWSVLIQCAYYQQEVSSCYDLYSWITQKVSLASRGISPVGMFWHQERGSSAWWTEWRRWWSGWLLHQRTSRARRCRTAKGGM